jgi:Protein of unknown function (DUF3987)
MSAPMPEPNTALALAFLDILDPNGRHDLAAIDPHSRGIDAATFFLPEDRDKMKAWIDPRQGKVNMYGAPNRGRGKERLNHKLAKADIDRIRWIKCDLDPTKLKGVDRETAGKHFLAERARILEILQRLSKDPKCPPTLVVDSGGGFWPLWKLDPTVANSPEIEQLVEGIERTLAQRLGGDSTFNVDRVMRLAGTINLPDETKAKQGREPALATIMVDLSSQKTYTLEQLAAWAPPTAKRAKQDAKLPQIDMEAVGEADDYDELPNELRDRFEAACAKDPALGRLWSGTPAPEQTDTSPSGYAFALAGRLGRSGSFSATEFGMLLCVWDQRSPNKEIDARYIARAWAHNAATVGATGFDAGTIADRDSKRTVEPGSTSPDGAATEWGDPADVWMDETNPADLPPGVVPAIIEAAARDDARRLGIEPGASAAARVVALGSLVPAGNQMQMRQHDTGWTVRPVLWMGLFGPPGSNKSATLKYAMAPVFEIEAQAAKRYAQEKRAYDAKHPPAPKAKKKGKVETALASEGPAETVQPVFDEPTPEPNFRRKLVEDATTEKLVALLDKNPDGLLYFGDELAGLFGGMDAYHAKAGKDGPYWLKFKDGAAVTVDRMGRDSIYVPVGAVSVLGGMQPDKIQTLKAALSKDGTLQRFLPIVIKRPDAGEDVAPDQGIADTVRRVARNLVDSGLGRRFRFTIEGDGELRQLESFVKRETLLPKASASFGQWLDKLPNEFGRIALVFHFVEWYARPAAASPVEAGPPEEVSGETARRARRFLEEFAHPHAAVFYNHILGASQIEEHARWVAGFIVARGLASITERDVYKNYSAFKGQDTRGDLTNTMRDLELNDWLRPTKFASGRPTHWAVNPAVHVAFAERARSERERRTGAMDAIAQAAALRRAGDKSPEGHPQ